MLKLRLCALLLATFSALVSPSSPAAPKDHFSVCWTIYAGWMPWEYAGSQGIVDKWAKKYGITIDVVQLNDYVESINQYTAGQFDGCTMTNMDALTIPAAGGVDSTALIVSDFSNGNDGIVLKGDGKKVADLKGMDVNLVELSVSHYLLARALDSVGLTEKDLKVVNTSDADISAAFNTDQVQAVTTWNPMLSDIKAQPGVSEVFNSSQIPGEIMDMMVVNTQTLQDNPALGKALTGAWFEVVALMTAKNTASQTALEHMAKASGTDLAGFQSQLDTTKLFATAKEALSFATSEQLPATMRKVAEFSFQHGLLGEGAKDTDAVGMTFANGVTSGDKANLKLRFDPTYVQLAADAKL
ncbi:putative urea ABC transporter substrate-binding protein [Pseudomonas fluorescens]|uniref:Urea ABC transporter substrate-binding protein n=1 Tax=Pseudomonas fluorescens TaxID=294 RepID=A0A944DME7_PSEFL|nr:putative urea ABC transporter substrate-binding protein [Pseudomonas fluorescens]MBT2294099.1 putative urea ABC transporter substrate-binding protein [Pseudomonas fluorescens]MBT2307244.1 putative urea ABC transporter substrate-binding protein [Pseudomonas fluorescens]MBT2315923.1 putative urea ABC transporter substrate-binding protein [Pseudomonas fluorescens]MBT2331861.1 putative urea ABC transporter substrate-binding protein [Pseudomonas fluorescens]MBT2345709.1 putative urea ABC transpo